MYTNPFLTRLRIANGFIINSLLIVGESLVDDLADASVETLKLLMFGADLRVGGLRREDAHEP